MSNLSIKDGRVVIELTPEETDRLLATLAKDCDWRSKEKQRERPLTLEELRRIDWEW